MTNWKTAAEQIKAGGVGVIPTDTLYGMVGSALKPEAVERIYGIRQRDLDKPLIVLIGGLSDLEKLGIKANQAQLDFLADRWPGPFSVILPCPKDAQRYLHRGTRTLAVRSPANPALQQLIAQTGPLVAPSANPQGQPPAVTWVEAQKYFGKLCDFYVDGGRLEGEPSTLIDLTGLKPKVLRGSL